MRGDVFRALCECLRVADHRLDVIERSSLDPDQILLDLHLIEVTHGEGPAIQEIYRRGDLSRITVRTNDKDFLKEVKRLRA